MNPILQQVMGALQNRTANPGADLAKQTGELQGADPGLILRQLESVNQVLGVTFVKTFQNLPNVANQISATMKALSRAIKEAQQAASVGDVVGKSEAANPPISFTPAQGGENAPGPQPGM
jgi:hypothetical protein